MDLPLFIFIQIFMSAQLVEKILCIKGVTHRHVTPLLLHGCDIDHLKNFSEHEIGVLSRSNKWKHIYRTIQEYSPSQDTQRPQNYQTVLYGAADYPEALSTIPDPPALLYYRGTLTIDPLMSIAIVGTRKCTQYAREACGYFSRELSRLGFTIISGLAQGIDTEAHTTALHENTSTWAVIGSGFDHIFPKKNVQLSNEISRRGALITEYPRDTHALPHHFPMRNRIVAGLSRAIIVVEAPEKSGSLITARLGLEYNRDVMIVPGQIFQKGFKGSHALIQEGAKLVCSIDDVLEEFSEMTLVSTQQNTNHSLPKNTQKLLDIIKINPLTIDELILQTQQSISQIQSAITQLEKEKLIYQDQSLRYHSRDI